MATPQLPARTLEELIGPPNGDAWEYLRVRAVVEGEPGKPTLTISELDIDGFPVELKGPDHPFDGPHLDALLEHLGSRGWRMTNLTAAEAHDGLRRVYTAIFSRRCRHGRG